MGIPRSTRLRQDRHQLRSRMREVARYVPGSTTSFDHTQSKRREPDRIRTGRVIKFYVGEIKGYIVTGEYPDGTLAEVFIKIAKQGSTLNGFAAWIATTVSLAIQHGVPLVDLAGVPCRELAFDPGGETNDPEIPRAHSVADYVMRKLVLLYQPDDLEKLQ